MGDVLTVPVYVPSYDQSGETHRLAVGDRVAWELAVADGYFPDPFLATVRATAEPAISSGPAGGTFLRRGGLAAWWDPGRPVSGTVELRAWFWMDDSRRPDETPETV